MHQIKSVTGYYSGKKFNIPTLRHFFTEIPSICHRLKYVKWHHRDGSKENINKFQQWSDFQNDVLKLVILFERRHFLFMAVITVTKKPLLMHHNAGNNAIFGNPVVNLEIITKIGKRGLNSVTQKSSVFTLITQNWI